MERHNRDEMLFSSPLTAQEAPPEKKRKIEPSNCGANGSMTSMKPRPPNLIPDPPEFRHYGNHYGESSWNKDSFRALLENNDLVDPNLDKGFKNSRHGGPGAYSRGGSLGEQPSAPTSPYEVPFIMDNKPISSQAPMQDLLSFNARAFSEFHTLNTEMTGKERTPSESIEKSKPVEPVETRKPVEPVKSVLTPIRSSLPLTSSPQANVACSTTEPAPQDQVSSSCKTTETSRPETSTSATSEETNSTINHTESTKEPEGTPSNEVKVKQEDASLPMKKSENKLADKSVDKEADIRATATEAADSTTATESSDPFGCLDWKNGIATLPGSNLKFKMTEFGTLEIVSTVETEKGDSVECSTATDVGKKETEEKDIPKTTDLMQGPPDESQVLCCEVCGVYGLPQDFCASGRFCSLSCVGKNTGRLNKGREIIRNATSVEGKLTKKKKKVRGGRRKNSPSLMDDDDPPYGEPISPKLKGVKPERGRGKPKAPMAEAKGTSLTASMVPYNFSKPFTWADYLYTSGAKPVPVSTFRQENPDIEVFTMPCEEFKKNMKLEAVDPKHPSYICVCTIVRVKGARLRLHFDGWSECYDFWTNADSPFIFPVGWCAKNGQVLHPQRGVLPKDFNWEKYLKKQNATAAPEHLFTPVSPTKHGFKTGMKLEAIDRKNPDLICVATVTNVIGNRFLVHFDEWDDTYDYWCEEDCPYIHPVGWCSANGGKLNPPNDDEVDSFSWEEHLRTTGATAAPPELFKKRSLPAFKPYQKLEAVDKRNPSLIRCATIARVEDYRVSVHFDGWDDVYDDWYDADSTELHPVGYCERTGHPLEPPLTTADKISSVACPTPGCKGIGHVKGAKYSSHHSTFGCPYSLQNLNKDSCLVDRLSANSMTEESDWSYASKNKSGGIGGPRRGEIMDGVCPTPGCDGSGHVSGHWRTHQSSAGCPRNDMIIVKISSRPVVVQQTKSPSSYPTVIRPKPSLPYSHDFKSKLSSPYHSEARPTSSSSVQTGEKTISSHITGVSTAQITSMSTTTESTTTHPVRRTSRDRRENIKCVTDRLFDAVPVTASSGPPEKPVPHLSKVFRPWNGPVSSNGYHGSRYDNFPERKKSRERLRMSKWDVDDVVKHITDLGCPDQAKIFKEQQIDGEALLLLNQNDIVHILKIKLGPALKIYKSIPRV